VAWLAANSAHHWQKQQLRRLAHRLDADPSLEVYGGDLADGGFHVIVVPVGSGPVALRGEPKIDAPDDGLDDWGVPDELGRG
jgi:hypothetical protein